MATLIPRGFAPMLVVAVLVGCAVWSWNSDGQLQPPMQGVYHPGDVVYITYDANGDPTGHPSCMVSLDSVTASLDKVTAERWTQATRVQPHHGRGESKGFSVGIFALVKGHEINLGFSGASSILVGSAFPDGDVFPGDDKKRVYGRTALRRAPYDDWRTTFQQAKEMPYVNFLNSTMRPSTNQRPFYVEEVVYTNAYYAHGKRALGASFTTSMTGRAIPWQLGAASGNDEVVYYVTADALTISQEDWDLEKQECVDAVRTNWIPTQVRLRELDLSAPAPSEPWPAGAWRGKLQRTRDASEEWEMRIVAQSEWQKGDTIHVTFDNVSMQARYPSERVDVPFEITLLDGIGAKAVAESSHGPYSLDIIRKESQLHVLMFDGLGHSFGGDNRAKLDRVPDVPTIRTYSLVLTCRAKSGGKVTVMIGDPKADPYSRDFQFHAGTHVPPAPPEVQVLELSSKLVLENGWHERDQQIIINVMDGPNMTVKASLKDATGEIVAEKINPPHDFELHRARFIAP